MQQLRAAETVKPADTEEKAQKAKAEPFTLMEGRLEFVQRRRLKLNKQKVTGSATDKEIDHDAEDMKRMAKMQAQAVPPPGMYNPKPVTRHIQARLYKSGHVSKVRPQTAVTATTRMLTEDDLKFNPDKLHSYVTGYVTLKTKTSRRPLTAGRDVVDEEGKQFEFRDIPRVSSRYRHYPITQTGQFFLDEEGPQSEGLLRRKGRPTGLQAKLRVRPETNRHDDS